MFEDVKFACGGIPDSVVHHIQFEKLDFGVGDVLDKFYAADVAIIDLSVQVTDLVKGGMVLGSKIDPINAGLLVQVGG